MIVEERRPESCYILQPMILKGFLRNGQGRIGTLAAALILGACSPSGAGGEAEPAAEPERRATSEPAGAAAPRNASPPGAPTFPGVVVPRQVVDVAAPFAGRVEAVLVDVGDRVEAGAPLVRLDTTSLAEDLRMSEAALGAAEAEQRRTAVSRDEADTRWRRRQALQDTFSSEAIAAARNERESAAAAYAAAEARVEEHRARVRQLRDHLSRATLTAPFTGTVAQRHLDAGAAVAPGVPVVRLITSQDLLVRFAVPPDLANDLQPGNEVTLLLDGGGDSRAVVERVAPEVDAPSQRIFVEARPREAAALPAGTTLRVAVIPSGRLRRQGPS